MNQAKKIDKKNKTFFQKVDSLPTYAKNKIVVNEVRNDLRKKYNLISESNNQERFLDSISYLFTDYLVNEIIPFWYDTPWDFNGHTSEPNVGSIACGYFVSTVLKDMGFNVDRYLLAQQSPLCEAKSIAIDEDVVLEYHVKENVQIDSIITNLGNDLYFVGLDNHVCFIHKQADQIMFIHSDYVSRKVNQEPYGISQAFKSFTYFFVPISLNKKLMMHWLFTNKLNVVTKY